MPDPGISLETIMKMGSAFPNVEQTTSWGTPALKLGGQMMACVPTNKSAEPGSFLFRIDRKDRSHLLAEQPELYYVTGHYRDYDAVLVRLRLLTSEVAHDLFAMAHKFILRKRPKSTARSS